MKQQLIAGSLALLTLCAAALTNPVAAHAAAAQRPSAVAQTTAQPSVADYQGGAHEQVVATPTRAEVANDAVPHTLAQKHMTIWAASPPSHGYLHALPVWAWAIAIAVFAWLGWRWLAIRKQAASGPWGHEDGEGGFDLGVSTVRYLPTTDVSRHNQSDVSRTPLDARKLERTTPSNSVGAH